MGKLVKCKDCSKKIAKGVNKCVHCEKDQRSFIMRHKILTFILIIMVIGVLGVVIGGNKKTNTLVDKSISINDYKNLCENILFGLIILIQIMKRNY